MRARSIGVITVVMVLVSMRVGYSYVFNRNPVAAWPSGNVTMHLQAGSQAIPLLDGLASWNASAEDALAIWNAHLTRIQFNVVRNSGAPRAPENGINNVFWSSSSYDGQPFGEDTLAVTEIWETGTTLLEADVIFNNMQTCWDSYRGPLRTCPSGGTLADFHRVALHEFGHVLGLDHPDEAGQVTTALMNSTYTDLDTLAADDIAGAQALYGPPDGTVPSVTITTPTAGPTYGAVVSPLAIGGTAGDNIGVAEVSWVNSAGGSGTASGTTSWSASVALQPGQNVITVTARDHLGNVASDVLTVTLTLLAPTPDFNGDTLPDLLWRNYATGANVVWHLNGAAVLSQTSLPAVADLAWQLVGNADIDRDGQTDAIWRNRRTGENVVWFLNGTAVIGQASLPTVADLAWQLVANADINTDGWTDVIWRNSQTGANLVWLLNGTTILSQESLPSVADLTWQLVAAADVNHDGAADLFWRNTQSGHNLVWYLNGTLILGQVSLPAVADRAWQLMTAVDINRDGKPDLVWRNGQTGANLVWYLDGTAILEQASLTGVADLSWRLLGSTPPDVVADVNGDRHPDLVWRNNQTGADLVWYLSDTAVLEQTSLPGVADLAWQIVGKADVNGDKSPDIIWRNAQSGDNVVWYLSGTTLLGQDSLPSVADQAWRIVAVADFNGDTRPDLLWRNTSSGAIYLWYLDGPTLLQQVALPSVADQTWTIAAAADINGDAHPDLIWRNTATGDNIVWYLDGAALLLQVSLPGVSELAWTIVGTSDFDGDTHPDLIWRNVVTGANVVWYLDGTSLLRQASLPSVADIAWTLRTGA